MKHILLSIVAAAAFFLFAHAFAEMTPEQMKLMRHVNPMPNLMMVVVQNKDQLDLSEEQDAALQQWRSENHPRMMKMAEQVVSLEKKLGEEALAGATGAVLQEISAEIFNIRGAIIKGKLACRNTMHSILNEEQWNKVVDLYKKQVSDG